MAVEERLLLYATKSEDENIFFRVKVVVFGWLDDEERVSFVGLSKYINILRGGDVVAW